MTEDPSVASVVCALDFYLCGDMAKIKTSVWRAVSTVSMFAVQPRSGDCVPVSFDYMLADFAIELLCRVSSLSFTLVFVKVQSCIMSRLE